MTRAIATWVTLGLVAVALAQDTKPAAPQAEEKAVKPATTPGKAEYVVFETTLGDIVLELDAEKAPISTKNFLDYVEAGFYKGTIFHRVIPNFMIQGGGYLPDLTEKKDGLKAPIKNEWQNGLKNVRGTIAMARTAVADSATAQFYINVVDNAALDAPRDGAAYAVFGKVVGGLAAVDAIRNTPTKADPKYGRDKVVPVNPVLINNARRIAADKVQEASKAADESAVKAKAAADKAAADAKAEADAKSAKDLQEFVAKVEQETGKKFEKTASGLMYLSIKDGDGPSPKATDKVKVHYVGTFFDGKEFDSSVKRGQPATFGLNQVIKGWTEGVQLMKVGGKAKLICPPDLAYGPAGRPGIPPNSTLVFEIELLGIEQ
jgi:peptidyl-prolyl cis-trans isomerase A (cyclophilin A)